MTLVVGFSLLAQGCQSTGKDPFNSVFQKNIADSNAASGEDSQNNSGKSTSVQQNNREIDAFEYEINRSVKSSSEVLRLSDEENIAVAFEQIGLKEFINHSLAKLLNVSFVIDPQVNIEGKTVTLSIAEKVSQKRFLELFKDVLEQNEIALKIQNGVVFLHGVRQRRGLPEYDYGFGRSKSDVPQGAQPIFHVVPINFIDAKSLSSFLIRLSNASPEALQDPNLLGIRGSRHDVLRALDIIEMLDVPHVRGKRIQFIKLEYLPSYEFIEKVSELLENEGVNVSQALRFTDLSRQNGVVIHSNNEDVLKRVAYWQKQLDTPESTDDKQYFMYYPENMEAAKLAQVLQKLIQVGQSSFSGSTAGANRQPQAVGAGSDTSSNKSTSSKSNATVNGYSEDFSFVSDENRNVIIIYAAANKYKSILPLLKKLDVTPPQVLIEAKLIEVTLKDEHTQGVEWSLFGGSAKRDIATSQLSSFAGSFSYTISGVDYNAALVLLEKQNKLKVLSSPRIVVANGESATLNVGTEIPVLSTQAADVDTDRVLQSIQYRSTGVDLTVSPIVNSSNIIAMQISQNVSETSENGSSGIDSPIILNRSFQTSVVANSGQTLVLGGLIRENNSFEDSQVPLLGDIPILGRLFSNESKSISRTELLVLITPRIIFNSSDIHEINELFIDELTLFD
ncbi:hypothetical protein KIH87_04690 [Paraneptunicella aestuarii]|uniref:secretin N-terminal domain-containing protein n=1 Tax=Paraneptunicella aestuarii TaxID=2831148 RepID=UPI001E38E53F|nr:secretin N-terminal domain-containing protein [Paraneptunicella aestuarii]UAA39658.1 hypothetical protein KIH87_04690 [Paraneptunicella aestuarii]